MRERVMFNGACIGVIVSRQEGKKWYQKWYQRIFRLNKTRVEFYTCHVASGESVPGCDISWLLKREQAWQNTQRLLDAPTAVTHMC